MELFKFALALLLLCCLASLGRASFMEATGMTTTLQTQHSTTTAYEPEIAFARTLTPSDCYRNLYEKDLDLRIFLLEIVEARLAIQTKLGLLDHFHREVEYKDFLGRTCLTPYRQFLAKEVNLLGLQQCNAGFVEAMNGSLSK